MGGSFTSVLNFLEKHLSFGNYPSDRHFCFCCVRNKSPKKRKKEDECLTEIYLTILGARSKNPTESERPCSLNHTGGTSVLCPPWASVSGRGWCSRLVPALVHSLPPSSRGIRPVWVCASHAILPPFTVSSKNTSLIALEPVQSHCELIHLNLVTLTKVLSPNKIISSGKTSTHPFKGFQVNLQRKVVTNTLSPREMGKQTAKGMKSGEKLGSILKPKQLGFMM